MLPTVMITGAGTGIGRALAINLARRGCNVIGIGRRLQQLEETKSFSPDRISIISADVGAQDISTRLLTQAEKASRPLYIVHNAATIEPISLIKNLSFDAWRHNLSVNLEAPLFITKALIPCLEGGRVLHISSGLAHYPCPGLSCYCMTKAALYMLYQCLSEELRSLNISVGSAMPGIVDTPMQEKARSADEESFPVVKDFVHFKEGGRLLNPGIVADFLSFVLIDTSNEEFSAQEWDIDDSRHVQRWVKS